MPKLLQCSYQGKNYLGHDAQAIYNNITKELTQGYTRELSVSKDIIEKHIRENTKSFSTAPSQQQIATEANKGKPSLQDVIDGAKAFIKVNSGDHVDQSEMNRRAGICSYGFNGACPRLEDTSVCSACSSGGALTRWIGQVKNFFGFKTESIPNNLGNKYCGACGCSLAMMIPSRTSNFNYSADKQIKRPKGCWAKKGDKNFLES